MTDFGTPKITSQQFIDNGVTFPQPQTSDGYCLIQPGLSIQSDNTADTWGVIQGVFIDSSGSYQMIIGDSYNP